MVILCKCKTVGLLPEERLQKLSDELQSRGIEMVVLEDLCKMVSVKSSFLKEISNRTDLTIAACHPRSVRWLIHQAGGCYIPDERILNVKNDDFDSLLERLPEENESTETVETSLDTESTIMATGWFPVVDYDRCKKCGQCVSFCPFGVYTLSDDGKPIVANPENCKDNCPACARMCPAVAIIFPKVKTSPIDGSEVFDEEVERRKAESLSEKLKGGDLRSILAKRRKRKIVEP